MVVTFLSTKGGVGKTTLALNVAHRLKGMVLVIDADPQQSCLKFKQISVKNEVESFHTIEATGFIEKQVARALESFDHVVIDTPGSDAKIISQALQCSSLVIVPTTPDLISLKELDLAAKRIKQARINNPGLKDLYVINQVNTRSARANEELVGYLNTKVNVSKALIPRLAVFPKHYAAGAMDWKHTKAEQQFKRLMKEIKGAAK